MNQKHLTWPQFTAQQMSDVIAYLNSLYRVWGWVGDSDGFTLPGCANTPIPSISTSTTSPGDNLRVAPGVPV